MIEVIDFKGHHWKLNLWRYKYDELWMWNSGKMPEVFKNYPGIPVPIFTEWWP